MNTWLRIIACWVTIITTMVVVPTTSAQTPPAETFVPNEVVVYLRNAADLPAVAAAYRLNPAPLDQFGTRSIYRLRIADGVTPPNKATALSSDARVIAAEPNYLGQTPEGRAKSIWAGGDSSGEYTAQWAPAKIGLPEAHQSNRGGSTVVAILDTGVDPAHPQLGGRLTGGYDFVHLDNDPREEQPAAQAYGHGTHVAGLVALAAPEARIMPVRMLDPNGIGNLWVTIEALAYAANPDGDVSTDDGADVINLSFSFLRRSTLLETIVREVTCEDDDDDDDTTCVYGKRGAVVVAAAGNNGSTTPEYPAAEAVPGLLSVAATTQSDTLASFSNRGAWVNISAPGAQIISSVPSNGYGTWSGTSMSAPLVAGVAALVRTSDSSLSPAIVAIQLMATAKPISGAPPRLDAAAALRPPVDGTCRGSVVGTSVANLVVPSGTTCTLRGTRVGGNLTVEAGASLIATGIAVGGDAEAVNGARITLEKAFVGGSVTLESNRSAIRLVSNVVSGDIELKFNTGGVTVLSNRIANSLKCEGNAPPPRGSGNQAKVLEGQCSTLNRVAAYLPMIRTTGSV
jgi:thermitase